MAYVVLMLGHLIGDFFLQSREVATTKAEQITSLIMHLLMIFVSMFISGVLVAQNICGDNVVRALAYALLTTAAHGIIDKGIWKFYKVW